MDNAYWEHYNKGLEDALKSNYSYEIAREIAADYAYGKMLEDKDKEKQNASNNK